jgi:hypothetical protein
MKLLSLIFLITTVAAAQSAPPRKDIPSIAKSANGAVVSIIMSDKDGNALSQGSGFLVSKDGHIHQRNSCNGNGITIEKGTTSVDSLERGLVPFC